MSLYGGDSSGGARVNSAGMRPRHREAIMEISSEATKTRPRQKCSILDRHVKFRIVMFFNKKEWHDPQCASH